MHSQKGQEPRKLVLGGENTLDIYSNGLWSSTGTWYMALKFHWGGMTVVKEKMYKKAQGGWQSFLKIDKHCFISYD